MGTTIEMHRIVAGAMVINPKVCPRTVTIGEVRELFSDDHVHAVLVADDRKLVSVVEREDLDGNMPDSAPAFPVGRLSGRAIAWDASLLAAQLRMSTEGRRRLAVVDDLGNLAGLLCLKTSGLGFCSDVDIRAREAERSALMAP
jgi:CBS domain-containing protein